MPVSLFVVRANTAQAKADLASLAIANKAATTQMQMAWSGVNKMFIAGAAGIAAMGGAFAVAYLANKDFNKSMVHTAALADLTKAQMTELGDQVLGLGIKYGESSNIIADGLVILAKAGLTQQEIMTAMPTIVQLMKANAVDFEMAANIAMMTMNAFGLSYDRLVEVGDKAQKTFQATLMDIEDLQQGLQYAASTAAMAGIPFESLLALMGTLADNAMVAGIASRSMNKMLLDIVMHTDDVQAWADSMGLGVEVIKEGKLNIDEIIPAFAKLGMSLETLIESSDIFTVRSLRAWGILIGHADEYDALLNQIDNSAGELGRTTDIQITSLSSMMTTMKEILLEPFKTPEFGEEMTKIMGELLVVVAELAPKLANLVFNLVVGFKESLPGLVAMLEGFLKTFQNILPVIMWFGKALAGINPMVIKLYLGFMLIKRLKMFEVIMSAAQAFLFGGVAAQQYTLSLEMLDVQITNLQAKQSSQIITMQIQSLELKKSAIMAQYSAQAFQQLAGAMMGVGFGIYMTITGTTRQARALGALITVVMAAVLAFRLLAMAQAATAPWRVAAQVAAVGVVGGAIATAGYAALSEIPEPETPSLDFDYEGYDFELPTGPGYQRGTRLVGGKEAHLEMVDPGEQISSANKESDGGGGDNYYFSGIFGKDAVEEISRELARINKREGRYPV